MLTSWEEVEKHFEVVRFSCGHSAKSEVVFERVCELFTDEAQVYMRNPSENPILNHNNIQVLLDLKKETESGDRNIVCNKFLNIVSELPISLGSKMYIMVPQLSYVHNGQRTDNTSVERRYSLNDEISQGCSVFLEWSLSQSNICNVLTLLDNLNQNITDLHVDGLNLCKSGLNIQQIKIRMDSEAESCNLVDCQFPVRVQKELGYQLSKCNKLKILNILGMPYTVQAILPHISTFIFLTGLNIANCKISEEVSSKLCNDLQFTPNLKMLDLSCNRLGPKGARNLARSIRR